ncbi:hypothetical protein [Microbacterium soli]|uniref:PepSY domain-containing protein n=1 Tax=Microbacterium soli TaxID=446075 RepID=A0ABP7NES2_9MICO
MQLGTRWATGTQPPASVPAELRPAIADLEARGLSGHWTLTWLEGRPLAELDAGWEVLLDAAGEVVSRPFQD